MTERITRRAWLERTLLLAGGIVAGSAARAALGSRSGAAEPGHDRGGGSVKPAPPARSFALSISELQSRATLARRARLPMPAELIELSGMNRFEGVIATDEDIVLLGQRDPDAPFIHVDDLMVAVRSAYAVDDVYRAAAPGCTIDPRDREQDPWRIQDVRVLGMPRCRMSRRHVDLDYELKFVGSGMRKLAGVPDTFSSGESEDTLCGPGDGRAVSVQNRFRFAPCYPDASPRFDADDQVVLIRHPIEVQVLTERQTRQPGQGETSPEAEAFAAGVTRLLAAGTRREYVQLRNDFRIIEVGRILRFKNVPPSLLGYLLHEHQHEPVDVPAFVVGIERTDRVTAVCGGHVEVTPYAIKSTSDVRRIDKSYRGGVDAGVQVSPAHFASAPGRFEGIRQRVERSRPAADALVWEVTA